MGKEKKTTYGITLTKFDPQYEDCIITRSSREGILALADKILRSVTKDKFSLMSELNKMQGEAIYAEGLKTLTEEQKEAFCFANKNTIPFYFINLLTAPYGLELGYVEVWE